MRKSTTKEADVDLQSRQFHSGESEGILKIMWRDARMLTMAQMWPYISSCRQDPPYCGLHCGSPDSWLVLDRTPSAFLSHPMAALRPATSHDFRNPLWPTEGYSGAAICCLHLTDSPGCLIFQTRPSQHQCHQVLGRIK